ncbi:beta-galactosidase [Paramyrothecium foliicola]|nr:beta-galactosidase [Paramyrothecium foliicola]
MLFQTGKVCLSLALAAALPANALTLPSRDNGPAIGRDRSSLNTDWQFWRSETNPDGIIYDWRQDLENLTNVEVLKPWILPSGNSFIIDSTKHHEQPDGQPESDIEYIKNDFDDGDWDTVTLPHDWAIAGPFYTEQDPIIGGGMGRLPVHGVGWYRRKLEITGDDADKQIYLDVDGAMSYAMVWVNEKLVGGWPYPYNGFRLDLTPYVDIGKENQLAIRLDNPPDSARWYPGAGLYRNVWLTKVEKTHIGQWGTFVTSKDVSVDSATLEILVEIENKVDKNVDVEILTVVHALNLQTYNLSQKVAEFPRTKLSIPPKQKGTAREAVDVKKPKLWGPPPTQQPYLHLAVTKVYDSEGNQIDQYETKFGIRKLDFSGDGGVKVNGERIQIQGVNEHHDLGAIGAAFNVRAAERKLEILKEMGTNGIRMAHNPPATELLELCDRYGFLVVDEVFDSWNRSKTANDFHLIFPEWHEQDLRSMLRRDRNHASIIMWSFGNEVGEQQRGQEGAIIGKLLHDIIVEEDTTRPTTSSMNFAQPGNAGDPFPGIMDILSLNYQGAGIRDTPNYSHLVGIRTSPAYPLFHNAYPDKLIVTSESASALSTRGTYFFPVAVDSGAPVNETSGGNGTLAQVSAYELYTANFGSSPDKVFSTQDRNPYVAGEFVWTGFDYIGEPTPYYSARSSYSGIIDLAGFKKDRFFLYQARWRPDLPMVHVLPHWNWPEREGEITPVHIFTSGDEAELFLNGESLGRKKLEAFKYRIRWDDVKYTPGELHAVAYKDGKSWAETTVKTAGPPAALRVTADRKEISADGLDLSFLTVEVVDADGIIVPDASNNIKFSACGRGRVLATDNGDPADMVVFPSPERKAYSGKALAIVAGAGRPGKIAVTVKSEGLESAQILLKST